MLKAATSLTGTVSLLRPVFNAITGAPLRVSDHTSMTLPPANALLAT
jgi:hypothetical protein